MCLLRSLRLADRDDVLAWGGLGRAAARGQPEDLGLETGACATGPGSSRRRTEIPSRATACSARDVL